MASAVDLNGEYLSELASAKEDTVLGRLNRLWWPVFLERLKNESPSKVLNSLDLCMDMSRERLSEMASEYAGKNGGARASDAAKRTQLANQFLKSNTGKMFERFVGLALAHTLWISKSAYCVMPFREEILSGKVGIKRDAFSVVVKIGKTELKTVIDADLIAFRPDRPAGSIVMLSIKSTLKDRFHNVPFWNLLRTIALQKSSRPSMIRVDATDRKLLAGVNYAAVCSDLAQEQPDFGSESGPRNLLQVDAALLDGAFVTASKAKGLVAAGPKNALGRDRPYPFSPLSDFLEFMVQQ